LLQHAALNARYAEREAGGGRRRAGRAGAYEGWRTEVAHTKPPPEGWAASTSREIRRHRSEGAGTAAPSLCVGGVAPFVARGTVFRNLESGGECVSESRIGR
jgi:hypothetical protein